MRTCTQRSTRSYKLLQHASNMSRGTDHKQVLTISSHSYFSPEVVHILQWLPKWAEWAHEDHGLGVLMTTLNSLLRARRPAAVKL